MEEELKRLRLELKHTMEMYNNACKEALTANQKVIFRAKQTFPPFVQKIDSTFMIWAK